MQLAKGRKGKKKKKKELSTADICRIVSHGPLCTSPASSLLSSASGDKICSNSAQTVDNRKGCCSLAGARIAGGEKRKAKFIVEAKAREKKKKPYTEVSMCLSYKGWRVN